MLDPVQPLEYETGLLVGASDIIYNFNTCLHNMIIIGTG